MKSVTELLLAYVVGCITKLFCHCLNYKRFVIKAMNFRAMKGGQLLHVLSDYQLLKKDSTQVEELREI